MPTNSPINPFGQPYAAHCSHSYAVTAYPHPLDIEVPDFSIGKEDENQRYVDTFVTSRSHNATPYQAFAETLGGTSTPTQHIPIWSLSSSWTNYEAQQQYVSTPNRGNDEGNDEWNSDGAFGLSACDPAPQGFAQSLSCAAHGFDQDFSSSLSLTDDSITNASNQPEPPLQFSELDAYNSFSSMPDGLANSTSSTLWDGLTAINSQDNWESLNPFQLSTTSFIPNGIANFTSIPPWDGSTAIDPQGFMASFNPLPLPITTSMTAAPALPTHAASMLDTPGVPRSIARTVTPRRSTVNTNVYTCDYTGCGQPFGRLGDLTRHRQKHGFPQYPCPSLGCNRRGARSFYRIDKLRDHQKRHRM